MLRSVAIEGIKIQSLLSFIHSSKRIEKMETQEKFVPIVAVPRELFVFQHTLPDELNHLKSAS